MAEAKRVARINIPVTDETKRLIEAAAASLDLDVASFVRLAAVERARAVLAGGGKQ